MKISSRLASFKYSLAYKTLLYINKNNPRTKKKKNEGLKLLAGKVARLPENIAFKPSFTPKSSCIKAFDKLYIFISKSNLKKPESERYDSLIHEIGHWLHFQNLPSPAERKTAWRNVNLNKIHTEVSPRAASDSKEFVAEVFKWLIKGKTFDEYIMNLYKQLRGPQVK